MPLFGLFSGLFRQGGLRATVYTLFGGLMLSTLWVTALVSLSAQANATDVLADAGAQVLNPFLVRQGLGLTPAEYGHLQVSGKAHPTQPLAVPLLKPQPPVLGREIVSLSYDDGVHLIYSRVATAYYAGGADAAFDMPSQLKDALANFALFNPNNVPILPNGPTATQLPVFLQPLFAFVGLTPTTFTAAGHQNLLDLLPWFWIAASILGVLAVALNRSEVKVVALLHGFLHTSWPIVSTLAGLWVASLVEASTFAPYTGILGVVDRAFLPVYAPALVLSGAGLGLAKLLPRSRSAKSGTAGMMASTAASSGAATSDEQQMREQILERMERVESVAGRERAGVLADTRFDAPVTPPPPSPERQAE